MKVIVQCSEEEIKKEDNITEIFDRTMTLLIKYGYSAVIIIEKEANKK